MVGHERARGRAPVHRLEGGGLDLHEAAVVEEAAHLRDGPRAGDEGVAHLGVGDQVEVPLAEAQLRVAQPAVLVRRRPQGLREQHDLVHGHAQLAAAGAGHGPGGPHDVPQVEVEGRRHPLLAQAVDARPELDAPAAVVEVEEGHLPLPAARRQPAGHAHRASPACPGLERLVGGPHRGDLLPPLVAVRERVDAPRPKRLGLRPALRDQRREPALGPGGVVVRAQCSAGDRAILTIWYSSAPRGAGMVTFSPFLLPSRALPTGLSLERRPFLGSASADPTIE